MGLLSEYVKKIGCLDLASAYHHDGTCRCFLTLLGFFLDGVYYMRAVLPFGLGISA